MGTVKLATEPSRTDALIAYFRTQVFPTFQQAERGVNSPKLDGVVRAILVDPGAEAGRAELEGHYNYTANRVIFATLQTFCETALVQS